MTRSRIAVSVVSHGQGKLVKMLLDDIASCGVEDIRVLLTVNIPENLPFTPGQYKYRIDVLENETPAGFGANHNAAFRLVTEEYFSVVNPDIRVSDDVFDKLRTCIQVRSRTSIAAPVVKDPSGQIEDSARRFPTPIRLAKKLLLRRRELEYAATDASVSPDWVGGMFMFFRSDVFRRIGGFDQRYFLYYEDVDICARLRLAGYDITRCNSAVVVHAARRQSHRSVKYFKWHLSSMTRFFLSPVFWRVMRAKRRCAH